MTVKELRDHLNNFPDDMQVAVYKNEACGYSTIQKTDMEIKRLLNVDGWFTKAYNELNNDTDVLTISV